MNQNFVPVVDDKRVFIGIVTRKDVWHTLERKRLLRSNDKPSVCGAEKKTIKTVSQTLHRDCKPHTGHPPIAGSVRSDSRIKTKVLVKDMTAEVFPSESAVKRADEKMLYPLNKKVTQNTEKPPTARS